jgi:hypothetical protein
VHCRQCKGSISVAIRKLRLDRNVANIKEIWNKFDSFIEEAVGQPYSLMGLLKQTKKHLFDSNNSIINSNNPSLMAPTVTSAYYCSELAAYAYAAAGLLSSSIIQQTTFLPKHFSSKHKLVLNYSAYLDREIFIKFNELQLANALDKKPPLHSITASDNHSSNAQSKRCSSESKASPSVFPSATRSQAKLLSLLGEEAELSINSLSRRNSTSQQSDHENNDESENEALDNNNSTEKQRQQQAKQEHVDSSPSANLISSGISSIANNSAINPLILSSSMNPSCPSSSSATAIVSCILSASDSNRYNLLAININKS